MSSNMKIVIVGCGRVGSRLAMRLERSGHEIIVIDEVREAFARLDPQFGGTTFQGSGLEIDVLRRSHVEGTDIVFALTGGDNRNLMIAQIVKHQMGVERAVARLHDPIRAWKYRELGIETMCTTTVLEGLLEIYVQNGEFPELPGEMSVNGDAGALDN
jgi:trk system potassium uptake protein TrkA